MCQDIEKPRFTCLYHRIVVDDPESITLDVWMGNNIPDDYGVVSILMDKIITDQIIFNYTVVLESKA